MNILKKLIVLSMLSLLLGSAYGQEDEGSMDTTSEVFVEESSDQVPPPIPSEEEEEGIETLDDSETL